MSHIRLCLSVAIAVAVASASVAAREAKLSSPGSGDTCNEQHVEHKGKKPVRASTRSPAPPRETRVKPSVHSDTPSGGRVQSPRWHSFLPGMFR